MPHTPKDSGWNPAQYTLLVADATSTVNLLGLDRPWPEWVVALTDNRGRYACLHINGDFGLACFVDQEPCEWLRKSLGESGVMSNISEIALRLDEALDVVKSKPLPLSCVMLCDIVSVKGQADPRKFFVR